MFDRLWIRSMAIGVTCIVLVACKESGAVKETTSVKFGSEKAPATPLNSDAVQDFRFAVADLADQLIPVVVSIHTEAVAKNVPMAMDPFEFFFGYPGQGRGQEAPRQQGQGSGVIVSVQGHILTNNHVVENADNIKVTLADKREFTAKIVGTDPQTDVAVLQLENPPKDLPIAYLGDSQKLRVGEWVVAVGSPYGLSQTVTTGIVSAKGVHNRGITSYENFIQTDAAINPGNSGGGLFNLSGELVGINTAILSRSGGFQGIGFAIPMDMAKGVMEDLVKHGKVLRGWLGVSIQDVDPALAKAMKLDKAQGALISEVFEGSPADKGGLKAGDVVLGVKGTSVPDANALRHRVALLRPGETVEFDVWRDGKKVKKTVEITRREEGSLAGVSPAMSNGVLDSLGFELATLTEAERQASKLSKSAGGLVVRGVKKGSLVARAGLREGDILLRLNQKPIVQIDALIQQLQATNPKSPLLFLIRRGTGQYYAVIER